MATKLLTFVEIDINYCSLTYGSSPCAASIPATGDDRCFNTRNIHADCQDPANFSGSTKTLRYTIDCGHLPSDISARPSLVSCDISPGVVNPGESIGERTTATLVFKNHPTGDADTDKYFDLRSYDPFRQGTYWGKFIARNSYIEGQPIRIYKGCLGDALEDMECYNLFIDGIDGPDSNGKVTVRCVDVFRFIDNKDAQAPVASSGRLSAGITSGATSATLTPTGVGNLEYPASGKCRIGKEVCSFTRSGDALTLTREQEGTEAEDHDADVTVQICLEITSQTAATIIYDLIDDYTEIPLSWITKTNWDAEVANYNSGILYSELITKPTPVKDLINQLVQQVGLVLFPDPVAEQIVFQVLRPIPTDSRTVDDDQILEGGVKTKIKEQKRIDQVWTFFNKKDKIADFKEENAYIAQALTADLDSPYIKRSTKKVFANWVPPGALSVAQILNGRLLSRYLHSPHEHVFYVNFDNNFSLGEAFNLVTRSQEGPSGQLLIVPCQVTSIDDLGARIKITAEEMRFDETWLDASEKTIVFDYSARDVNLRSAFDSIYSSTAGTTDVYFQVTSGVVIGSSSTESPGLDVGDWPAEINITLTNSGFIVGRGGDGSNWNHGSVNAGGDALLARRAITINNDNGVIGGGGGGGEKRDNFGSRGGGGAGNSPGLGQSGAGANGTLEAGGVNPTTSPAYYPTSGTGGDLGEDGTGWSGAASGGGAAGNAVDGDSYITWTNLGDIRGARVS